MTWLTTIAISNALIATLLAIVAYVASRYSKSTAVGHALWILVLVKLITPPLFDLPLPVLPVQVASSMATMSSGSVDVMPAASASSLNAEADLQNASSLVATSAALDLEREFPSLSMFDLRSVIPWLLGIWLTGMLLYGGYQLYVTWQMCRLMKLATPDCRIDRAMHRIAKQANVKNYPTARVVPWVGSPMLWGLGGTSVIVLPEQLFDSLDDRAADTLLQHELAHFHRGDQWVRILEVITSTVFWWLPTVWLAIREIEVYEEQCCDAWVVRQDYANRRRYAEALLDTVDFISDAPDNALPIAASGLGRVPLLQQRLESIMRGNRQLLSSRAKLLLAGLVAFIPFQPKLLQATFLNRQFDQVAAVQDDSAEFGRDAITTRAPFSPPRHLDQSLAQKLANRQPVPEIEYATAGSAYGTYQLIAASGYRAKLNQVIAAKSFDLSEYQITCADFAPPQDDQPRFVAGCADGSIWLFDCELAAPIKKLGAVSGMVHSICYSPDGDSVAAGVQDGSVQLISLSSKQVRAFGKPSGAVRSVRFSRDGEKLIVATDSAWEPNSPGRLDIWDVGTGSREWTVYCPAAIGVAAFSDSGNILAAEWDGTLRIWSRERRLLSTSSKPKDSISAAAFSPDAITLQALSEMDGPFLSN